MHTLPVVTAHAVGIILNLELVLLLSSRCRCCLTLLALTLLTLFLLLVCCLNAFLALTLAQQVLQVDGRLEIALPMQTSLREARTNSTIASS